MNGENFEQVTVPKDMVGDYAPYLQENMTVTRQPARRRADRHRAAAARDAGSGRDRADDEGPDRLLILQAGAALQRRRTLVPGHIVPGTRIIVMTEDGSYAERAKD